MISLIYFQVEISDFCFMKTTYNRSRIPSSIKAHKFHQALGYLFYAVASADKIVAPKEVATLKQLISRAWLPLFRQSEIVFQIQFTFDKLSKEEVSSRTAFEVFKKYKRANRGSFNDQRKKHIWTTVNSIAETINGKNKSELILLSQLSVLLKE